jgi:hypothetical protein
MKMVLVLFYYQKIIKLNYCFLQLCYLVATSTAGKSQLFQRWREWEYIRFYCLVAHLSLNRIFRYRRVIAPLSCMVLDLSTGPLLIGVNSTTD